MKLHGISQDLAIYTVPGSWEPFGSFTEDELADLRKEAVSNAWNSEYGNTTLGRALEARGGAGVKARLAELFDEIPPPSVVPFYETVLAIMKGVLVDLPLPAEPTASETPAAPPKAPTPEEVMQMAAEKMGKEREGKVRQFAKMLDNFMYANANADRGVPRCRGGVYTIVASGTPYQYPKADFESLLEDTTKLGLVR